MENNVSFLAWKGQLHEDIFLYLIYVLLGLKHVCPLWPVRQCDDVASIGQIFCFIFFQFCLSTSSQIMKSLMTKQVMKLGLFCIVISNIFSENVTPKMSRVIWHAGNGKLASY